MTTPLLPDTARGADGDAAARPTYRRFTADEVLSMVDCGILGEDEPVELLDGALVVREPQAPSHAAVRQELSRRLDRLVEPAGMHVRDQSPVLADADSLPEPDLAVVRGRPADYRQRHPTGADTLLVVEVAVTSRWIDRAKARLYARAGIPVYWLLDVSARTLTVHEDPRPERSEYATVRALGAGDAITLPVPGVNASLTVASMLE